MPGKHDPSKKYITFSIKRELWYKLTQYAEEMNMDRTALVVGILESEMRRLGVKLTEENLTKVETETKKVRDTRRTTWSRVKKVKSI